MRLRNEYRQAISTYTENEVAFLKNLEKNSVYQDEELWGYVHKLPRQTVEAVLKQYLGVTLDDVTIPEKWAYLAETDAYYDLRTDDYGVSDLQVTEVKRMEDGTILVYWSSARIENTLTGEFIRKPRMVLSNLPVE